MNGANDTLEFSYERRDLFSVELFSIAFSLSMDGIASVCVALEENNFLMKLFLGNKKQNALNFLAGRNIILINQTVLLVLSAYYGNRNI